MLNTRRLQSVAPLQSSTQSWARSIADSVAGVEDSNDPADSDADDYGSTAEISEAPMDTDPSEPVEKLAAGTILNGRYEVLDVVGEGGMACVYRVRDLLFPNRATALKTFHRNVDPLIIDLFRSEFRAMAALDHPHIARVYDFEAIAGAGGYLFTMDFILGQDLGKAARQQPWPKIVDWLVQVAAALQAVHNRSLLHLDLKPANVMVDEDGLARVLDFGLVGVRHGGNKLFGTLVYMAPEVFLGEIPDRRADLYGLGVMAFELLHGRVPFYLDVGVAELLQQKLHDRIQFSPSDEARLPDWLRQAVRKLCAARPDDRFDSAAEAIAALTQSRNEGAVSLHASAFVGREEELHALLEHIENRLAGNSTAKGLMLVAAQSGMGKSRLVRESRHALQVKGVSFLQGDAFDQDVAEFTPWLPVLLGGSSLAAAVNATALRAKYGPEIVKVAPTFGHPITYLPSPPLENVSAERRRIVNACAEFFLELSQLVPHVIYLNDLQWALRGSIEILTRLARRLQESPGARLALLGSYRSNEIKDRPVESLAEGSESQELREILALAPLRAAAIGLLVQSVLGAPVPDDFVAQLVTATQGLPLFVEETVLGMAEVGAIILSGGACKIVGSVEMNVQVDQAILRRIERLDPALRQVLDTLAVCGRPVEAAVLAGGLEVLPSELLKTLRSLADKQLVVSVAGGVAKYNLAHDRIRESLVNALAASELESQHRRIGRMYLTTLDANPDSEPLFITLLHLNQVSPPPLAAERLQLAKLNLAAGKKARATTANAQALSYVEYGLKLLHSDSQKESQPLWLALLLEKATVLHSVARLDDCEEAANQVIRHTTDILQEARAWWLWIACQKEQAHYDTAVDAGLDILQKLGVKLKKQPTALDVAPEVFRFWRTFRQLDLAAFLDRPPMSDPLAIETFQLMLSIAPAVYLVRPRSFPVLIVRLIETEVRYGRSDAVAMTIAGASVMMIALKQYGAAARCTAVREKALSLTVPYYQAREKFTQATVVSHWFQPLHGYVQLLHEARAIALEEDDFEYALYAAAHRIFLQFACGDNLPGLIGEIEGLLREPDFVFLQAMQHKILIPYQCVLAMVEGPRNPRVLTGRIMDEAEALKKIDSSDLLTQAQLMTARYIQMGFWRTPLPLSAINTDDMDLMYRGQKGFLSEPIGFFYISLSWLAALRRPLPLAVRLKLRFALRKARNKVSKYAQQAPFQHEQRQLLLQAEELRTAGQLPKAIPVYRQAIAAARKNNFVHEAALGCELLAEVQLEIGQDEEAKTSLLAAQQGYAAWGAAAKVKDLQIRYSWLLDHT